MPKSWALIVDSLHPTKSRKPTVGSTQRAKVLYDVPRYSLALPPVKTLLRKRPMMLPRQRSDGHLPRAYGFEGSFGTCQSRMYANRLTFYVAKSKGNEEQAVPRHRCEQYIRARRYSWLRCAHAGGTLKYLLIRDECRAMFMVVFLPADSCSRRVLSAILTSHSALEAVALSGCHSERAACVQKEVGHPMNDVGSCARSWPQVQPSLSADMACARLDSDVRNVNVNSRSPESGWQRVCFTQRRCAVGNT